MILEEVKPNYSASFSNNLKQPIDADQNIFNLILFRIPAGSKSG